MPWPQIHRGSLICLLLLSATTLLPGLGSSGRLTYHEAFVAQGAREILLSGSWAHPTIGGLPWLEKPPLPWWLVTLLAQWTGGVSEIVARFPSALAAIVLSFAVAGVAGRHYGSRIGLLAGAVQATTVWTVMRGRLAEADILLASLIAWAMFAFDSLVNIDLGEAAKSTCTTFRCGMARWAFFVLLGMTSLVKGIGFGAVLILTVVAGILGWERSGAAIRRLWFHPGWAMAAMISLAWPLLIMTQYGSRALSLWTMHVADRVAGRTGPGPFAGEPWWEYTLGLLGQALPWTPFAFAGAWSSLSRLVRRRSRVDSCQVQDRIPAIVLAGDRLLWMWATIPLGLFALATVKNAHYAISAQVPWSIWAALSLNRLGERLRLRGWGQRSLRLAPRILFATLAVVYSLGYWLIGPWFDRRGVEWAFYESVGRRVSSDVPLTLLYDDWDRNPYESSFGPIPHDLAVRLFYLGRPACWHIGADSLSTCDHHHADALPVRSRVGVDRASPCPSRSVFSVIGRDRDLPALERLGSVEVLARGPNVRFDRTYLLFQVTNALKPTATQPGLALSP